MTIKLFILAPISLTLAGCCGPSECRIAKSTFEELAPVTTALVEYENTHGLSPNDIETLFPGGLPPNITAIPPKLGTSRGYTVDFDAKKDIQFSYTALRVAKQQNKAGSRLSFGYTGPGFNHCSWTTETKKWDCGGGF